MKSMIIRVVIFFTVFAFCIKSESTVCRYSIMEKKNVSITNKVVFYQDWHMESYYDAIQADKVLSVFYAAKNADPNVKFLIEAFMPSHVDLFKKASTLLDTSEFDKLMQSFIGRLHQALKNNSDVVCLDTRALLNGVLDLSNIAFTVEDELSKLHQELFNLPLSVDQALQLFDNAFDVILTDAQELLELAKHPQNRLLIEKHIRSFLGYKNGITAMLGRLNDHIHENWFKVLHDMAIKMTFDELKTFFGPLISMSPYLKDKTAFQPAYNWMFDIRLLKNILVDQDTPLIFVACGMGHWDTLRDFLAKENYAIQFDSGVKFETYAHGKILSSKSYKEYLKYNVDPMAIPIDLFERFIGLSLQKHNQESSARKEL